MNDEKKGVKKMRTFAKSSKLDNVCYDIRGPVMDEANRMIEQGVEILKLNIGNPAPFGFKAPQELVDMMRGNLENAEGYSDSRGLLKSRQAIVEYCKILLLSKLVSTLDVTLVTSSGNFEKFVMSKTLSITA